MAVLRPTWLPKTNDEYQIVPEVAVSADRLFNYGMSYYEMHSVIGQTVWHIDFSADSLERPGPGLQEFGGPPEAAMVRGHAADLFGSGSPGWTLVWTEENYRYAIQAFGVSREELLHITASLAPVIDAAGQTTPTR